MIGLFRLIILFLNSIRCIPHLLVFFTHKKRDIIKADTKSWLNELNIQRMKFVNRSISLGFLYLLAFHPEYRNLFYYRIRVLGYLFSIFCRGRSDLFINSRNIGEGLFIRHGFATAIGAKSIGKNCQINQQVTITSGVTILDNVKIFSGAVIHGKIIVGNNSVIGANATVMRNVPDNCTVIATPPRIIHWNEERSYLKNE